MTNLPDQIVLHLGAHKTATTHLQRSLAAAAPTGVAIVGPPQLRGAGQTLPERFGFPLDASVDRPAVPPVRAVLAGLAGGAARLVLSDENFAGKLQTGWGRVPTPLYPTAPKRIAALATAVAQAGGPPVTLCLALRDPAEYLSSIYSQILRGGRVIDPAAFVEKNPVAAVDWADYAARLQAVPGITGLTVWRYEDYSAVFAQICNVMTGVDSITPLPETIQPRLSARAVEAVLQVKAAIDENRAAAAAKAFPVGPGMPPVTLYDGADMAQSRARYAAQWAQITAMPGVTAIQPAGA